MQKTQSPKETKKDLMHGDEEKKKELQKKYMQFQLARQYVAALTEEHTSIEAKLSEIAITATAIEQLKKTKKNEEIWSSLGSDAFVTSDIKDTSTAIVGVGAGVYVRKPVDEAIQTLKARHAELTAVSKQLVAEINSLNQQLAALEPEIQAGIASFSEDEKK